MAEKEDYTVSTTPYPARIKQSSALINNIPTTATSIYFADKIMVTVTQNGRLAHWIHVPLDNESPAYDSTLAPLGPTSSYLNPDDEPPNDLLPAAHLTATTVLGGTVAVLDTLGQLLATQIASAVLQKDAGERRMVVCGFGLEKGLGEGEQGRESWGEVVGLVLGVL